MSENQCGHIKHWKLNEYVISHLLPCAIDAIDISKALCAVTDDNRPVLARREIFNCASKYGIANDASRDRPGRKKESAQIVERLLRLKGMQRCLNFLESVIEAQGRDYKDKRDIQIHDLADAITLPLEKVRKLWKKRALLLNSKITATTKKDKEPPIQITISDDADDDFVITYGTKTTPDFPSPLNSPIESFEQEDSEEDGETTYVPPVKSKKKRKREDEKTEEKKMRTKRRKKNESEGEEFIDKVTKRKSHKNVITDPEDEPKKSKSNKRKLDNEVSPRAKRVKKIDK